MGGSFHREKEGEETKFDTLAFFNTHTPPPPGLVRDNVIINAHSSCTAIADICIDFSGHFIGGYFA